MKPGRDLDKLIQEKVFGHEVVEHNSIGRADYWYKANERGDLVLVPQYSMHIASAWLVMEKIKQDNIGIQWVCDEWYCSYNNEEDFVRAPTAPHAICLAALKVTEK